MTTTLQPTRWYALMVHARQEKAAAAELSRRAVSVFLPTRTVRRAWSDRVQRVDEAVFPGYLFVRCAMTAAARVELLKSRLVFDVVGRRAGLEGVAPHVPDDEIEALRRVLSEERELDPVDRLVAGAPVVVAAGPMRGLRGVVEVAPDGRRRLVVQVTLLGRGVRTVLSAADVVEGAEIAA